MAILFRLTTLIGVVAVLAPAFSKPLWPHDHVLLMRWLYCVSPTQMAWKGRVGSLPSLQSCVPRTTSISTGSCPRIRRMLIYDPD
jgi:hypothetical protein